MTNFFKKNFNDLLRYAKGSMPTHRMVMACFLVWAIGSMPGVAGEAPAPAADGDHAVDLFSPVVVSPNAKRRATPSKVGRDAVRLNRAITDLPLNAKARFSPSGGANYEFVYDGRQNHLSGNATWSGYLKGYGDDYRAVITFGDSGVSGRILTPDGEYLVESDTDGEWLIDPKIDGSTLVGADKNDFVMPLLKDIHEKILKGEQDLTGLAESHQKSSALMAPNTTLATIDVMILYTPGMVSTYGNSLSVRLDQLVALANQAYRDSGVYINLRLVHQQLVNYSDTTSNETALHALKDNTGSAFAGVGNLRDAYGADLVSLIRPYYHNIQGGCGIGSLSVYMGHAYPNTAFTVVSDGWDVGGSNMGCSDLVFTHELGHNMGCHHDRANAGGDQGAYPYSYGYGISGTFGTIMSYISPWLGKFSNPMITCNGMPCGISETAPDAANNALSLNNTSATVAGFRATKIPPKKVANDLNADGRSDLVGVTTDGQIFYTMDLAHWINIPGRLARLVVGDFNGDGQSDLAGLVPDWLNYSAIFYTTNLVHWTNAPGRLARLAVGDFNGDGRSDLAGLAGSVGADGIYYTTDLVHWTNVPGALVQLVVGDFNGDGRSDLAGLASTGGIYYTTDLIRWTNISGALSQLVVGDFNGDGRSDLAGLASTGGIYYTTDLIRWTNISGALSQLVVGDFNGDGRSDLAGLASTGGIYYTTDLIRWTNISGTLSQLVVGDFNGDGRSDLAGLSSGGNIYYSLALGSWINMPGLLYSLAE